MGSISHIRLREGIFFSGTTLFSSFAYQKFGWFLFGFLFCAGVIEEEIDYARYATFATLRSLRYATLQTEEDRRKNDEGFLVGVG